MYSIEILFSLVIVLIVLCVTLFLRLREAQEQLRFQQEREIERRAELMRTLNPLPRHKEYRTLIGRPALPPVQSNIPFGQTGGYTPGILPGNRENLPPSGGSGIRKD